MASKATKRAADASAVADADAAPPSTRDRILESAEKLFADFGFDGASIRQIAMAAGTPVALLSYYFGSKEGLYRAVFDRRVPTVVEQRMAGLDVAAREPDLDCRLELIVAALVVPMLQLRAHDKDPSFGRLMAHETVHPNSQARGVVRDLFDPVARKVMEALASALPGRSIEDINWAYQFMIGALVFVMADTGRIARLSAGRCRPEDDTATVRYLVSFLTAGVRFGLPVLPETRAGRPVKRRKRADGVMENRRSPAPATPPSLGRTPTRR